MRKTTSGFTIVELLIVIVIIGILAAVTIVAYNGIQQRARNAQIANGVKTYQKALVSYAIDNHAYPGDHVCLGGTYPSAKCWNGPNGTFTTSSPVDTALAKYISTIPVVSDHVLQITGMPDYRLGILLIASGGSYRMTYYLEGGGQTCIDGSSGGTEMQGTQCQFILPDPSNL